MSMSTYKHTEAAVIINKHVLPLVGRVKHDVFDAKKLVNIMRLQMKIIKHTSSRNMEKVKMYLAFCIQQWRTVRSCPVDREVLKKAIYLLGE